MKTKNNSNNLAIIGASGTGKTVLATGLYATSTTDFSVKGVGDETTNYLNARKSNIQNHEWPAATNEEEFLDLLMNLKTGGKEMNIVFREYMGERMDKDPNYIKEVIGTPKVAMILFNPGMPGLKDNNSRNKMISKIKNVVEHLEKHHCSDIAFVVTASDRLSSDLAGFRDDFEKYAAEVTNYLGNSKLNWKRFDVSVSGELADQNRPDLASGENNTTREPFLWLLDRIHARILRDRIRKTAATAAILLAVAGAAFGGLVCQSRAALGKAEREIDERLAALDKAYAVSDESAVTTNAAFLATNGFERIRVYVSSDKNRRNDLVKKATSQNDLWGVRQLAMEFAATTNSLASTPLKVPLNWFDAFDKKLISSSPSSADAVSERGELADAWEKSRKAMETVCKTAHFRNEVERESKNLASAKEKNLVEPLKASFVLLMDTGDRYALVTNRSELSAPLLPARTNAIARYVDSETVWEPTDPNPPGDVKDLIRKIRQELKSALSSEEFANLETIVEQRRNEARIAWEKHQFPLRRKAQLDELKAASDSPAVALKDSLSFLGDMDGLFPSIPETDRVSARAAITNERALAIGRYIDSKTRCKPEDDDPPGSVGELHLQARTDLKGALTTVEFDSLESKLTQRRDKARSEWDAYHFPKRLSELETALKGAGTSPATPLKKSLAFLGTMTNDYPTISQADFIQTRTSLTQARNAALAAYGKSIADEWDVNGRKPPEFDGTKIRDTILTEAVVTDSEASAFSRDMEKRFQAAKAEWDRKQKRLVDDFAVGGDPETMVRNYGEFCDDWPTNPYLGDLCGKVDEALQEYFRKFLSDYSELVFTSEGKRAVGYDAYPKQRMEEAQRLYNKLVGVCRALNGDGCKGTPILDKPSGKFAKLCCDEGGLADTERGIYSVFQQKLRITKIEALVRLTGKDSSYLGLDLAVKFRTQRWNYSSATWETMDEFQFVNMKTQTDSRESGNLPKSWNENWVTLWTGTREFLVNPYTMTRIDCSFEDRLDATWSQDMNGSFYWYPYLDPDSEAAYSFLLKHSSRTPTEGDLKLRVTAKRNGPDFWTFARKAGLNL